MIGFPQLNSLPVGKLVRLLLQFCFGFSSLAHPVPPEKNWLVDCWVNHFWLFWYSDESLRIWSRPSEATIYYKGSKHFWAQGSSVISLINQDDRVGVGMSWPDRPRSDGDPSALRATRRPLKKRGEPRPFGAPTPELEGKVWGKIPPAGGPFTASAPSIQNDSTMIDWFGWWENLWEALVVGFPGYFPINHFRKWSTISLQMRL